MVYPLSEFRLKRLPRDEESMKEIIEEISKREHAEGAGVEGEEYEEEHEHGHEHEDPMHEQLHIMEHILAQLSQLDAKLAGIDRGLSELSSKIDELVRISRALVKISLAGIIENRDARKKLIEDVMEEI
jgi:acetylglutamate synthase